MQFPYAGCGDIVCECGLVPQVTHWQHPRFHAYFPAGNSFPSILGGMLSDGIGSIGFSWVSLALQLPVLILFLKP